MSLRPARWRTWLPWFRRVPKTQIPHSAVAVVRPARPATPPATIAEPKLTWQRFALEYRTEKILTLVDPKQGVDVGDVTFLDDGSVSIGSHSFANGVEIVNHHLGVCVANRDRGARSVLVIDRHDGESYYYAFQHGQWYRLIPVTGTRNVFLQTLREDIRQHGLLFVLNWLGLIFNALCELLYSIGISFVILFLIREIRR